MLSYDMAKNERSMTKLTKRPVPPSKTQVSLGIHPVWIVFAVRIKKHWDLGYPSSAQRRLWSDWADAQADPSLYWAHIILWFLPCAGSIIIICVHVLAHKLPGDDGEFYQFCYVASNYQIRGASTPFQFRKPSANDFVEIEDEETNMLVIRSKTVVLQENLQHAESQKNKLIEVGNWTASCQKTEQW